MLNRLRTKFNLSKEDPADPLDSEGEVEEDDADLVSLRKRLNRRQALVDLLVSLAPRISLLLILAGFVAVLLLPTHLLSRSTYISENAILPGQVNTYWSWGEVNKADRYAEKIEEWRDLPTKERGKTIKELFQSFGLRSQTQSYTFTSMASSQSISNGTNVHAILHAPRTDGAEALVLMASWLTRRPGSDVRGGDVNVRGVASVLALAEFLISFNLWSKDIIFLIADGYIEGTHAWLKAYHGVDQSNLKMEELEIRTGSIWAALNLDFPFHSFSHIGIEYEGINGQLPNLDLINSIAHIVRWTGSCPITIHDEPLEPTYPNYLPDHPELHKYIQAGRTIIRQMSYGLMGSPSGPEGTFSTYRIDAISLFAYPADGPHGFHTLGKIVESSLRSLNNLLERLHQSFFLYLMQSEQSFISVGMYLIVPLLFAVGLTIKGLALWASLQKDLKSCQNDEKEKLNSTDYKAIQPGDVYNEKGLDILWSLRVISFTHIVGIITYWAVIRCINPTKSKESRKLYAVLFISSILPLLLIKIIPPRTHDSIKLLEPIQLMLCGCFISVISVLNFPLGAAIGIILNIHPIGIWALFMITPLFGFWYNINHSIIFNDQILQSWFLPFGLIIFLPLLIQSFIVYLLKTKRIIK